MKMVKASSSPMVFLPAIRVRCWYLAPVSLWCFLLAYSLLDYYRDYLSPIQGVVVVSARNNESCLDPVGPIPFILLTQGRSGSSSTFQILTKLTGYQTGGVEYPAGNPAKSREFFENHTSDERGEWMLRKLCEEQATYPDATLVGFKWKPFPPIFSPPGKAAFRRMGELAIPVVRNRRNLLDVFISQYKNKVKKQDGGVHFFRAHCENGDEDCLRMQLEGGTGLVLPTRKLVEKLRGVEAREKAVDEMLVEMGVPTVHVTYERLYYAGNDTSEWTRIFHFLGVGPTKGLTRETLEGAMELVPTHNPTQKVTLANFANVSRLLQGTEFEHLLH